MVGRSLPGFDGALYRAPSGKKGWGIFYNSAISSKGRINCRAIRVRDPRRAARNLAYDRRHARLRLPPSVLIAYYHATNANRTRTLSDELIHQVECMIAAVCDAERRGRTVYEVNPVCPKDELTDRWPADLAEQRVFIDELTAFAVQLKRLRDGVPFAEMQRVLENLFGERPAQEAVRKYTGQHVRDNAAGKSFHILRSGSIPALGSAAVPAQARATPRSSPWGD